ncbi:amino acid adenylation domain-containing protein [Kordia zhangzhouensis]|uniref:amino acid adenylation domain-containing protein n=1 Tax=Kordia zhangzhouensis TaxID=1620405 RepID=UPI00069A17CD|nr:amino acid adenylation domain-containing protein [Kordia zhangzhouensis]
MNTFIQFLYVLQNDSNQWERFNAGSNKTEITKNRIAMLQSAKIEAKTDIVAMSANELRLFISSYLDQTLGSKLAETCIGLIKRQMLQNPDRVAIIDGTSEIYYKDLQRKVDEVAGELKSRGISKGSLIGVCMNRTWQLVAALLGVMQSGCAYVPLDPTYPKERIDYMLVNSQAVAAIVSNQETATLCNEIQKIIRIGEVGSYADTKVYAKATDLAYVIYTSGSTGAPKGVAVEQRNVVAMRQSMKETFSTEELNGLLAAASVCFDTSVMEILGTLSLGGTIILAKNALDLTQIPAKDKVKTCVMVPSSVQALLSTEDFPKNLTCLVFGGEALKRSVVELAFQQQSIKKIFNAYGPTEDTVYSTIAEISRETKVVTIGTSVPDSRSYILDEELNVVPIGEAGELHLAGSKLARGYLYDEIKTKERFITIKNHPQIRDKRLYKTGDLCRRLENGEIEFLGRVDQQVKIRGYRIELGEIESTLESMDGIQAAAAIAIEGGLGQKMLAVHIVKNDKTVSDEEIKDFLGKRLPKYMVPQRIYHRDELPLLPNDKLDRKKLATISKEQYAVEEQEGTSVIDETTISNQKHSILTTIQKEVAAILNLQEPSKIVVNQSFDGLGLDSLTILEFSNRLSKMLGKKISARTILENATPELLANQLSGELSTSNIKAARPSSSNTLSVFQSHIQSSHPTFQAAKVATWNVTDKSKLVQEVMKMVNDDRRNPYSKILKTGSATKGIVGDAYNDDVQDAIIWTTNLYLGLNRDSQVMKEASKALQAFGTGMGTSAAASGMTDHHLEFEKEFAALVGKPSACLFPTGYTANVGAVAGLLGANDVVIIDQLCHASIVDGARLCGATVRTFKHNSAENLEAVLQSEVSPYKSILVVLEGVYSMGEGAAPVATIVQTAKKYGALVLVDEAHSFGFYGKNGAGICAAQGVTEEVDFIMTTLSKALGSLGGVVAASQEHVNFLKSSSRAYIFQASISPADMAAALTALRRIRTDQGLRDRLWETTRYMRKQFEKAGYDLGTGDGPIVTPHFSDKDKLYAIVQGMYKRGVQTSAVTYPIVENGKGRLRFICSAAHTKEDVDTTLKALQEAEKEVDMLLREKKNNVENRKPLRKDLMTWSDSFISQITKRLASSMLPVPDFKIKIATSKEATPIIIQIEKNAIRIAENDFADLSYCSLIFKDQRAVTALCTHNTQALLDSICDNTCELAGQTEPFVWLFARLIEQQISIQENNLQKELVGL